MTWGDFRKVSSRAAEAGHWYPSAFSGEVLGKKYVEAMPYCWSSVQDFYDLGSWVTAKAACGATYYKNCSSWQVIVRELSVFCLQSSVPTDQSVITWVFLFVLMNIDKTWVVFHSCSLFLSFLSPFVHDFL